MNWWVGGSILVAVGVFLRRLLRMGVHPERPSAGWVLLRPGREIIYQPMAQELETQCSILGISLNEAFEERDSGRGEIAWRLVQLCAGEWDRIAEFLAALLAALSKHLKNTHVVVPVRNMPAQRFKSQTMVDYFRMRELLDQLVFRSQTRYHLQIRVLRRAEQTLTREFRRACRIAGRTDDRPPEFWRRLDLYYHDLDLLAKESLLAFRTFLACLPEEKLGEFAADLQAILRQRERTAPVRAFK